MRVINSGSMPLAKIHRARTGYQMSTFLVKGNEHDSITQKSNEYRDKINEAEYLPIVIFDAHSNTSFSSALIEDGSMVVYYCSYVRITARTVKSVLNHYREANIEVLKVEYNWDEINVTIKLK